VIDARLARIEEHLRRILADSAAPLTRLPTAPPPFRTTLISPHRGDCSALSFG
jgi:hypothetical protein